MPAVGDEVFAARFGDGAVNNASNVTGAANTIIGLVTLFFALGIMAAGVSIAVNGLKNAGMF